MLEIAEVHLGEVLDHHLLRCGKQQLGGLMRTCERGHIHALKRGILAVAARRLDSLIAQWRIVIASAVLVRDVRSRPSVGIDSKGIPQSLRQSLSRLPLPT